MQNKYLINVIVPIIELDFDVYIPNNKKVGTIKTHILNAIREESNNSFKKNINDIRIIDRDNGKEFDNNVLVKDSGIKNGSKVVII